MATGTIEQPTIPGLPERTELAVSSTPAELIRMAVLQGANVETLERLMDLQLRWEANEARKAFVSAMAAFKANPPKIVKNKHVKITPKDGKYGPEYDHSTLDLVCDVVGAALARHGISYRWKTEQPAGVICVTCILTHCQGHSEETMLSGPADTSGLKNPIQAIGSTVTYLQRYTLLAATGLATGGSDNDGRSPEEESDELNEQLEFIANASAAELNPLFKRIYKQFQSNQNALRLIVAAKDFRKRELGL